MNKQKNDKTKISKLAIVSFTTGLLGILSFFLMFNWSYGEFLVLPTLLLGFICLISGVISAILEIEKPQEMTGQSLILRENIKLANSNSARSRIIPRVVVEHNEAFYYWFRDYMAGMIGPGSILINVDEHTDLKDGWVPALPQDRIEAQETDEKRYEIIYKYARSLSNEHFITPAVYYGLFSEIYWVVPDWVMRIYGKENLEAAIGSGKLYTVKIKVGPTAFHSQVL